MFSKALLTDKFIGESEVVELDHLQLGLTQLNLPIWDSGKHKRGTVLIRIDISVQHELVAETTEESESEVQPNAFLQWNMNRSWHRFPKAPVGGREIHQEEKEKGPKAAVVPK